MRPFGRIPVAHAVLVLCLTWGTTWGTTTVDAQLPPSPAAASEAAPESSSDYPRPVALGWPSDSHLRLPPLAQRSSLPSPSSLSSSLQPSALPAHWWAPIVSAAVPGAGQFVLKQQRSAAYAAAEGYLLLQYFGARRDGNRDRETYRQLAIDIARRQFGGTFPVGPWEYYERMEYFLESGAFNRNPSGAFQPETDENTYNGNRWRYARDTYWRDPAVEPEHSSPEYQLAIDFYKRTAVPDAYRWSWRDATLEQTTYKNTIASANRSYQRAVNYAGVLLVNHLASLIDAYVSVRVRRYGGAGLGPLQVQGIETRYEVIGDPGNRLGQWRAGVRLGGPF